MPPVFSLKLRLLAKSTTFAVSYEVTKAKPGAGLTQQELAKLLGTDPSVIDGLEEADYEGNALARCDSHAVLSDVSSECGHTAKPKGFACRMKPDDWRFAGLTAPHFRERANAFRAAMMRCIAAALNKRVEIRFAPLESVAIVKNPKVILSGGHYE